MIVNLVIVLVIVIILFNSITYSHIYKCPQPALKFRYVRASRLPGLVVPENEKLFDTMHLSLDRDIPCGIYKIKNTYGNGLLFVSKFNKRIGYMTMQNLALLNGINLLDLWDLERINSNNDLFIRTYNSGCC